MSNWRKLIIGIFILVLLSPIGIILPAFLNAGEAWGEWGPEELKEMIGYIPKGLEKLSSLAKPLLPDYNIKGWEDKDLLYQSIGYIISGAVGVLIVIFVTYIIAGWGIKKKDKDE